MQQLIFNANTDRKQAIFRLFSFFITALIKRHTDRANASGVYLKRKNIGEKLKECVIEKIIFFLYILAKQEKK